jgi:xanthine dehydrogenase YagR molybdenum-binding subunit
VAEKQNPNDRVVQGLQDDVVLYQDQPIAVVVADTLEHAQHAAALVTAAYDATAAVSDVEADLAAAFVPETARGPAQASRGDVAAGLSAAKVRIDATYTTPVETHNPMEPHATIAVWHGADHLTLYDSTQAIFNVRRRLSAMLGLAPENVRVINHFVASGARARRGRTCCSPRSPPRSAAAPSSWRSPGRRCSRSSGTGPRPCRSSSSAPMPGAS